MRVYTAIRLPSLPHVNNFFQITISEFLGEILTIFIKLDRLSSVAVMKAILY